MRPCIDANTQAEVVAARVQILGRQKPLRHDETRPCFWKSTYSVRPGEHTRHVRICDNAFPSSMPAAKRNRSAQRPH